MGAQPPTEGIHVSVTAVPLADVTSPPGAFGALVQALVPTIRIDSLEGALTPPTFCARTRTKYVPEPTPDAENVVAVLFVALL